MGRFAGLSGIKTNQGGIYFLDGDFLVDIAACKYITARDGIDAFIVETTVVESTNEKRGPGSTPSQVVKLKPIYLETAMGNIKQFAAAALGIANPDTYVPDDGQDPDDFWDEAIEFMVSDDQPLANMRIRLNCVTIKTRAGGDFTKHVWGAIVDPETGLDQVAA